MVAITVRLFSSIVLFIICTALRYRSIYLKSVFSKGKIGSRRRYLPNRTDVATVVDRLPDLESIFKFLEIASRDGLLDEQSDSRELLQKLGLDISPWDGAASEHRWTSDDNSPWVLLLGHGIHKLVQVLANPCVFIGGFDEACAFLLKDGGCAVCGGVYESDDLQPRPELTRKLDETRLKKIIGSFHLLFESKRMVPWAFGGT